MRVNQITISFFALSLNLWWLPAQEVLPSPPKEKLGKILFGETPIFIERDESRLAIKCSNASYEVPRNRYVSQVKAVPQVSKFIFNLYRLDKAGGSFFEKLVLLDLTQGDIVFTELFTWNDLVEIDGRRRSPIEIGNVTLFPIVEILMSTYEFPDPPTRVRREWETWNLFTVEMKK